MDSTRRTEGNQTGTCRKHSCACPSTAFLHIPVRESETRQIEVIGLFAESALRHGPSSNHTNAALKLCRMPGSQNYPSILTAVLFQPAPKSTKKTFDALQRQFTYLSPRSNPVQKRAQKNSTGQEDFLGEYQTRSPGVRG